MVKEIFMKKRDNVEVIFNDIMSNENYIDTLVSEIKNVRTSVDLYLASIERVASFDDTMKLREILENADAIVKAIQSF